jgi:hypothetical protein
MKNQASVFFIEQSIFFWNTKLNWENFDVKGKFFIVKLQTSLILDLVRKDAFDSHILY